MRGLLRIAALLLAFLVAAASSLFLLPMLKEGYGPEELALLARIGGGLI